MNLFPLPIRGLQKRPPLRQPFRSSKYIFFGEAQPTEGCFRTVRWTLFGDVARISYKAYDLHNVHPLLHKLNASFPRGSAIYRIPWRLTRINLPRLGVRCNGPSMLLVSYGNEIDRRTLHARQCVDNINLSNIHLLRDKVHASLIFKKFQSSLVAI